MVQEKEGHSGVMLLTRKGVGMQFTRGGMDLRVTGHSATVVGRQSYWYRCLKMSRCGDGSGWWVSSDRCHLMDDVGPGCSTEGTEKAFHHRDPPGSSPTLYSDSSALILCPSNGCEPLPRGIHYLPHSFPSWPSEAQSSLPLQTQWLSYMHVSRQRLPGPLPLLYLGWVLLSFNTSHPHRCFWSLRSAYPQLLCLSISSDSWAPELRNPVVLSLNSQCLAR